MPAVFSCPAEEHLLRAAQLCATYSLQFGVDVPVPHFVLFGKQCAGKTRAINVFAKAAIGYMQALTATRCPVIYNFICDPNSPERFEVDGVVHDGCDDVYRAVERVMKELEAREEFSLTPIVIKMRRQKTLDLCIVDLPGLRPDRAPNAEEDNKKILAMWQEFAAKKATVPVIVTKLDSDPDVMISDIKTISEGIANSNKTGEAIVLVSKLDEVMQKDHEKLMNHMLKVLKDHKVGRADQIIFLSLVPEMFDRMNKQPDETALTIQQMNSYFENLSDLDDRMMRQHVPNSTHKSFNLGIAKGISVLTVTATSQVRDNLPQVLCLLVEKFEILRQRAADMRIQNPKQLRKDAENYVELFCTHIHALANFDTGDFSRALQKILPNQPCVVKFSDTIFLNFNEEIRNFGAEKTEFIQEFRKLEHHMTDDFARSLAMKICGGSAMLRLLRVWMLVVLKRNYEEFTVDTMVCMGTMTDPNGTRGWTLEYCLKKMIAENAKFVQRTIGEVTTYARKLFASHAGETVNQLALLAAPLLSDAPSLRAQLEERLSNTFGDLLQVRVDKTFQQMKNALQSYFASLKLDGPFRLVQLLCSNKMPRHLLARGQSEQRQIQSGGFAHQALAALPGIDDEQHRRLKSLLVLSEAPKDENIAVDILQVLTDIPLVEAEDFILSGGIKFDRIDDNELWKKSGEINAIVRSFTYLHHGLAMMDAVHVFDMEMEQPLKKMHDEVCRKLLAALSNKQVMSDEVLQAIALGDAQARIDELDGIKNELDVNCAAQRSILQAARSIGINHLQGTLDSNFRTLDRTVSDASRALKDVATRFSHLSPQALSDVVIADPMDLEEKPSQDDVKSMREEIDRLRDRVRASDIARNESALETRELQEEVEFLRERKRQLEQERIQLEQEYADRSKKLQWTIADLQARHDALNRLSPGEATPPIEMENS